MAGGVSGPRSRGAVRIAFVNAVREFGGGERWMIATGAALASGGHQVSIIHRPAAVWQRGAAEAGLRLLPAAMTHDLSVPSIAAVASALRRARPDVVVACNQRSLRLGALAARLAGAPPVVFRCGLAGSFRRGLYNRSVARLATQFVANAGSLAPELAETHRIDASRLSVIYNGVDTRHFRPFHSGASDRSDSSDPSDRSERAAVRARWGVAAEDCVIFTAGRLVRDKGHADLIAAAKRLRGSVSCARIMIAGQGSEQAALAAAVRAARVGDIVQIAGFQREMPAAYRAADIYCQPSHREGLPNSVLEAMASGLAVVATQVDGTPEAVDDGVTGLLVRPGDPEGLVSALRVLATEPRLRRALGQRARARVEARFSAEAAVAQWETLLETVCARGGSRAARAIWFRDFP